MAFQYASACYADAVAANTAAASDQIGQLVTVGGVLYAVDVGTVTSTSIQWRLREVTGGPGSGNISKVITITPQPCGLLTWEDGLALSWGVVAAWALTYAVMFLARTLRNGVEYGDA